MAFKTVAGEVQHDEQQHRAGHDRTDDDPRRSVLKTDRQLEHGPHTSRSIGSIEHTALADVIAEGDKP